MKKPIAKADGDLSDLVAAEDDLAVRLDRARTDARELVEAARRQAEDAARAALDEEAGREAGAAAQVAEECRREGAVIGAAAQTRARAYDELAETTVAAVAEEVLEFLLEETPA